MMTNPFILILETINFQIKFEGTIAGSKENDKSVVTLSLI